MSAAPPFLAWCGLRLLRCWLLVARRRVFRFASNFGSFVGDFFQRVSDFFERVGPVFQSAIDFGTRGGRFWSDARDFGARCGALGKRINWRVSFVAQLVALFSNFWSIMTLLEQDLLKRLQNCGVFGTTHRAAFAPTSRAIGVFDELGGVVTELETIQNQQIAAGGGAIGSTRAKSTILGELWRDTGSIDETARQMKTLTDQQKGYFVRPDTKREVGLVGAARTFIEQGTPIWAKFVAYELAEDLLTDMQADLDEYDATYGEQQGDRQERVGATTELEPLFERGNAALDELRPIIKNKFKNDAGILAAWASAVRYPQRDKVKKVVPGV